MPRRPLGVHNLHGALISLRSKVPWPNKKPTIPVGRGLHRFMAICLDLETVTCWETVDFA